MKPTKPYRAAVLPVLCLALFGAGASFSLADDDPFEEDDPELAEFRAEVRERMGSDADELTPLSLSEPAARRVMERSRTCWARSNREGAVECFNRSISHRANRVMRRQQSGWRYISSHGFRDVVGAACVNRARGRGGMNFTEWMGCYDTAIDGLRNRLGQIKADRDVLSGLLSSSDPTIAALGRAIQRSIEQACGNYREASAICLETLDGQLETAARRFRSARRHRDESLAMLVGCVADERLSREACRWDEVRSSNEALIGFDDIPYSPTTSESTASVDGDGDGAGGFSLEPGGEGGEPDPALRECRIGLRCPECVPDKAQGLVCRQLEEAQNRELMSFSAEMVTMFDHMEVKHYFSMLRIQAITKLLEAHRRMVGRNVNWDDIQNSCGNFRNGIQNNIDAHGGTHEPTRSGQYFGGRFGPTQRRRARDLIGSAEAVRDSIRWINDARSCSGRGCPLEVKIIQRERRLERQRARLNRLFAQSPFLSYGRTEYGEDTYEEILEARDRVSEGETDGGLRRDGGPVLLARFAAAEDDELGSLSVTARTAVGGAIVNSLKRFCGGGDNGYTWRDLVRMPELVRPVLDTFANGDADPNSTPIAFIQQCALGQLDDEEASEAVLEGLAMGGCITGTIATLGVLGPACGAVFLGIDMVRENEAESDAEGASERVLAGVAHPQVLERAGVRLDEAEDRVRIGAVTYPLEFLGIGAGARALATGGRRYADDATDAIRRLRTASSADEVAEGVAGLRRVEDDLIFEEYYPQLSSLRQDPAKARALREFDRKIRDLPPAQRQRLRRRAVNELDCGE